MRRCWKHDAVGTWLLWFDQRYWFDSVLLILNDFEHQTIMLWMETYFQCVWCAIHWYCSGHVGFRNQKLNCTSSKMFKKINFLLHTIQCGNISISFFCCTTDCHSWIVLFVESASLPLTWLQLVESQIWTFLFESYESRSAPSKHLNQFYVLIVCCLTCTASRHKEVLCHLYIQVPSLYAIVCHR